jgi:hypothetical protein
MPDFILTDLGNEADTQFDPDAAPLLKAAGRAIPVSGAAYDSAPQLTTDSTLLTGTGHQVVSGSVATALRPTSTPCRRVSIHARTANAGTLYVGLSTVTADTNNLTGGIQLLQGEWITFGAEDLADVFIHGANGDGCSFLYEL